jgi:hypothetical protein
MKTLPERFPADLINSSENSESLRNFGEFCLPDAPLRPPSVCHLTDPSWISSGTLEAPLLAHFLRGNVRGSPLVQSRVRPKGINLDRSLDDDRGSFATQGESHEEFNRLSVTGRRLRRSKHYGSERRRMRSRCVPSGLRRRWRCRGCPTSGCASSCFCAARRRCPSQSVLIIVHVSSKFRGLLADSVRQDVRFRKSKALDHKEI